MKKKTYYYSSFSLRNSNVYKLNLNFCASHKFTITLQRNSEFIYTLHPFIYNIRKNMMSYELNKKINKLILILY